MRRLTIEMILATSALLLGAPGVFTADSASAAASGAAAVQRLDPSASSPVGVIYQIPLDHARRDAAPVAVSGAHGNSGDTAAHGSSSATAADRSIGGSAGTSADNGASRASSNGEHRVNRPAASTQIAANPAYGTPSDPSSIHSENGFGSSSDVPGVSPAAAQIGAGIPARHVASSPLPRYLLIVLIAVAATIIGVLSGRASRPRPPRGGGRPGEPT
jgi:hypothetical protein